jgi:hypothetical protein
VSEDGRSEEGAPEPAYRPKPPLWAGKPHVPLPAWALVILFGVGAVVVVILLPGFHQQWLSSPAIPIEVTVVRLETGEPGRAAPRAPSLFHYVVSLQDGSEARFTSDAVHRPGERLLVMSQRSRLTGGLKLGSPFSVLAPR